jgi:predicted RNase H-like nuclease
VGVADTVVGIDGCTGGWVVAVAQFGHVANATVSRTTGLDDIVEAVESGRIAAVGIDIPIGLPDAGPRRCDLEARKMIGLRRNSVFPAPIRPLIGASSYDEAVRRSRSIQGKGLSKQAFAILPKIVEIDELMTPDRQQRIMEVHPEACFTALFGSPMAHHKSTNEGRLERVRALKYVFPSVDEISGPRIPGTRPDDVLDALVAAWSAHRWLDGRHVQLGGDIDRRGLRMEIIA